MLTKILLIFTIFFSFYSFTSLVFWAATSWSNWNNNWISQANTKTTQSNIAKNLTPDQKITINNMSSANPSFLPDWTLNPAGPLSDWKNWAITKAAQKMSNSNGTNTINPKEDISKKTFEIGVGKISPGNKTLISKVSAKKTATDTLQKIIDNLMTAFWVLALLVMTIWWGYMIMYNGQDELLSKWKAIFNSGLLALVVALSSWILVKLVAYLLY